MIERIQYQTISAQSLQIREQIRQAAEEGRRVQLPESTQDRQEEGVHHGRGGTRGNLLIHSDVRYNLINLFGACLGH